MSSYVCKSSSASHKPFKFFFFLVIVEFVIDALERKLENVEQGQDFFPESLPCTRTGVHAGVYVYARTHVFVPLCVCVCVWCFMCCRRALEDCNMGKVQPLISI